MCRSRGTVGGGRWAVASGFVRRASDGDEEGARGFATHRWLGVRGTRVPWGESYCRARRWRAGDDAYTGQMCWSPGRAMRRSWHLRVVENAERASGTARPRPGGRYPNANSAPDPTACPNASTRQDDTAQRPATQPATTASNAETHQHDNGLFRHPSNRHPIPRCGAPPCPNQLAPAASGTGGLGDRRSGPGGESHAPYPPCRGRYHGCGKRQGAPVRASQW